MKFSNSTAFSLRGHLVSPLARPAPPDRPPQRLNDTVSPFTNLKLLYLSENDLFGELPRAISSLHRLLRLDLFDNNL
jgi:hypothetical protein